MDRSAHVWGQYKALLTVISSYNWWVVFPYISFSWLTAFLKSRLNGKLIGWLNLHFNQSIYDRGSPRTHWQRVRRHSLRDWGRELALEYVHSPITSPVIYPKASLWGRGEKSSGLLTTGHTPTLRLIFGRKGQTLAMPREWNPGHTCVSSVTGCQMLAPWAAKSGQAWLPSFLTKDFTYEGEISWPEEPASPISSLGWQSTQQTPRRPQKTPQPQIQRNIYSRTSLNSSHFKC